jgi:HEAT repeat protein
VQIRDAVTKLNDADKAVRDAAMGAVLQARERAVPALIEVLAAPGAPVAVVALLLAALKARAGIPRLVELVHKGVLDIDSRAVVARAFAELMDGREAFDTEAKAAVLALSRDDNPTTRALSVKALHALGDGDSEERLTAMAATDPELATRKAALDACKAMRAVRAESEAAHEDGAVAFDLEAAVHGLSSAHGEATEHKALLMMLRDPRWGTRAHAVDEATALASGPKRAEIVAVLVDLLAGSHVGARIGAAQALARIAAPAAARALLDVVLHTPSASNEDEQQLRAIGLKALACCLDGSEAGFAQALLPMVRDADPFVRAGALLCLGRLADRAGARAATAALTDPHDHVVEAAAVALSEGTREEDRDLVLPLLAVLGGSPSPRMAVREAILLALSRINIEATSVEDAGPTAADHNASAIALRLRHRVRPSVLAMTANLRRTAIAILERSYTSDDPAPLGIVDDILSRLADEHAEVRLLAASFLARHLEPGMTAAVEKIEDALDRDERSVSLLCLEALRRHDTNKAMAALRACADDLDEQLAARAKELLVGFEPKTKEWVAPSAAVPFKPERRKPSRVRAVRNSDAAEAVEAKDPPAHGPGPSLMDSLKDRLAALQAAAAAGSVVDVAGARATVVSSFAKSIPAPGRSLEDELAQVKDAWSAGLLNDAEMLALRAGILASR